MKKQPSPAALRGLREAVEFFCSYGPDVSANSDQANDMLAAKDWLDPPRKKRPRAFMPLVDALGKVGRR